MKKIMKTLVKGLSLLLAVIMSMAIVGCGPSTNDPTANAKEPELIYFGQHDYTAPDIEDKWLVKDGKTEYFEFEVQFERNGSVKVLQKDSAKNI